VPTRLPGAPALMLRDCYATVQPYGRGHARRCPLNAAGSDGDYLSLCMNPRIANRGPEWLIRRFMHGSATSGADGEVAGHVRMSLTGLLRRR
jgi:hypothetical protein